MTLYEALLKAAAKEPGRTAISDRGKALPYSQLRDAVGRLSNLYQAEIPKGQPVAILSGNSQFFAQSFLAVSNAGVPILLLNPADTDESIIQDLRAVKAGTLLVSGPQVSRARDLFRREKLHLNLVEIEKKRAGEYDTSFHALPDRPVRKEDPVLLLRLEQPGTQRRFAAFNHEQVAGAALCLRRPYHLSTTDRVLTNMSWAHPFALTHGLLLPLFNGATAVVDPESPSVEEFVDFLASEKVTRFAGPPKFYFQLLSYCASRKYTLPGVKSIVVGMGSISLALRKTYQLLKIPVARCYGRPEAVWSLAMDDVEEALDIESARSKPLPGIRFAVLTEDGEEIPGPGTRQGRLAVLGGALSATIFAPERKPNENFRGTWLITDEVARLEGKDDEQSIAILGKVTDMLCVEGDYLSPRRIDQAATKLPGVTEAAGFVRYDNKKQPKFACALVMNAGKVNEKELLESLREELPDEFHPETLHFVSSLPRDVFDSVNRLALQRQFSAH